LFHCNGEHNFFKIKKNNNSNLAFLSVTFSKHRLKNSAFLSDEARKDELHLKMCSRASIQQRTKSFKVLSLLLLFGFLMFLLIDFGVKSCEKHLYEWWDTLPHQLDFIHSSLSLLSGPQFLWTYEACCKSYIFQEVFHS